MARNPIIREHTPKVPAPDETPHACYEGWVYLGFEGEDESGEHVEEIERVPCRRCHAENLLRGQSILVGLLEAASEEVEQGKRDLYQRIEAAHAVAGCYEDESMT
jgi:hypothetical protein